MTRYYVQNTLFFQKTETLGDSPMAGKCEIWIKYFSYCGRLYASSMVATLRFVPYALLELQHPSTVK